MPLHHSTVTSRTHGSTIQGPQCILWHVIQTLSPRHQSPIPMGTRSLFPLTVRRWRWRCRRCSFSRSWDTLTSTTIRTALLNRALYSLNYRSSQTHLWHRQGNHSEGCSPATYRPLPHVSGVVFLLHPQGTDTCPILPPMGLE